MTTRQMQCSGVWPSGTTYITFEDVKVNTEQRVMEREMVEGERERITECVRERPHRV